MVRAFEHDPALLEKSFACIPILTTHPLTGPVTLYVAWSSDLAEFEECSLYVEQGDQNARTIGEFYMQLFGPIGTPHPEEALALFM